mmetsp:Transcript_9495/g.22373  ORF Transcript_9495/g.22373 Transcript_9495/m.22373 type:complete len:235 (-) Transcript_9495:48-752(-)
MPRLVKEGESSLGGDRFVSLQHRCVANKIQSTANDVVISFHQHLRSCQCLAEQTLVQKTKLVPDNSAAKHKHEIEDIAPPHEMDELVDPGRDAIGLVQGTVRLGPPQIVTLDAVNAFGQVHPIILRRCLGLLETELPNQPGAGGEVGRYGAEGLEQLLGREGAGLQGDGEDELPGNGPGGEDELQDVLGNFPHGRKMLDEHLGRFIQQSPSELHQLVVRMGIRRRRCHGSMIGW